jgi:hypothetical protein
MLADENAHVTTQELLGINEQQIKLICFFFFVFNGL